MKTISLISCAIFCFTNYACSKKSGSDPPVTHINHAPVASLAATVKNVSPFTVDFKVTASDEDNDVLSYQWDFGEGTIKDGIADRNFYIPRK